MIPYFTQGEAAAPGSPGCFLVSGGMGTCPGLREGWVAGVGGSRLRPAGVLASVSQAFLPMLQAELFAARTYRLPGELWSFPLYQAS